MKKTYIKPVMTDECMEMDCILNLQSGGTTSGSGITTAGGRNLGFDDEDDEFNESSVDCLFH